MRKILSSGDTESAAENLLQMLVKTSSNAEFIEQLKLQMRLIDKAGYTFRGTGLKINFIDEKRRVKRRFFDIISNDYGQKNTAKQRLFQQSCKGLGRKAKTVR
ncbi:MAG: hypothetical protein L6V85_09180 [Clostridiales bacterium]|nr:MAG: hypothetical protein L6V85_09180 [Clostridiales bacterium]